MEGIASLPLHELFQTKKPMLGVSRDEHLAGSIAGASERFSGKASLTGRNW
jgi:hypothetical protein